MAAISQADLKLSYAGEDFSVPEALVESVSSSQKACNYYGLARRIDIYR